jgi:hypothetical protein
MAKVYLSALGVFALAAQAQTFGVHVASVHSGDGMNNFNPGAYVRFDNGLTAGTYLNSHKRQSAYVGYTLETAGALSIALTVGVVSGYKGSWALVVPSAAYHTKYGSVRLGFVPKPPVDGSCSALHLMLERKF